MENTLYWITRCDSIVALFVVLIIVGIILIFILSFKYAFLKDDLICDTSSSKSEIEKRIDEYVHKIKMTAILTAVCAVIMTFIPTTKECYIIYGVGKTVDYLQSNKEAQKLPNNVIKALNYYLEEMSSDSTKCNKN